MEQGYALVPAFGREPHGPEGPAQLAGVIMSGFGASRSRHKVGTRVRLIGRRRP